MATDQEIRDWAKADGLDVSERGRIAEHVRVAYADAHRQQLPEDLPEGAVAETRPNVPPKPVSAPAKAKRKLSDRIQAMAEPPKARGQRVPLDGLGRAIWQLFGKVTPRVGLPATGRMLQWQAPFAGVMIENALKGSMVDRIVQPLARLHNQAGPIGALVAAPVMVAALERDPALYPVLGPLLEDAVISMMLAAGPQLKKAAEEREKVRKELGVDGLAEIMAFVLNGEGTEVVAGEPVAA